jgi:hypothetical protein
MLNQTELRALIEYLRKLPPEQYNQKFTACCIAGHQVHRHGWKPFGIAFGRVIKDGKGTAMLVDSSGMPVKIDLYIKGRTVRKMSKDSWERRLMQMILEAEHQQWWTIAASLYAALSEVRKLTEVQREEGR